jgi:HSP20 family protein
MFTTRGTNFDKAMDSIFDGFKDPIWKTSFCTHINHDIENVNHSVDNGILYIALPGFSKEDIDISIDGRTLIVSAEISEEDSNSFRKSFTRKWILSDDTTDEVTANMNDGLLALSFGRVTEKKKVKIS